MRRECLSKILTPASHLMLAKRRVAQPESRHLPTQQNLEHERASIKQNGTQAQRGKCIAWHMTPFHRILSQSHLCLPVHLVK